MRNEIRCDWSSLRIIDALLANVVISALLVVAAAAVVAVVVVVVVVAVATV